MTILVVVCGKICGKICGKMCGKIENCQIGTKIGMVVKTNLKKSVQGVGGAAAGGV